PLAAGASRARLREHRPRPPRLHPSGGRGRGLPRARDPGPGRAAGDIMSRRTQRLSEEIREEVARIIPTLNDPRVGFVTVTRTEMTPDLRTVRVHVGVLGDAHQRTRTLQGLAQAAGFIRRELGRRLSLPHTPEVSFHYDE